MGFIANFKLKRAGKGVKKVYESKLFIRHVKKYI
jgi:hypothetical protein